MTKLVIAAICILLLISLVGTAALYMVISLLAKKEEKDKKN
jgi:hypothetical protein